MTTPMPPGGNIPQGNVGGLIGNLLGGASGSLGGTNALQASLDQLTNAVNNLSNRMTANVGGGGLGYPTRQQQGQTATQPFPRPINPFQQNQAQPGIGGGGPGGSGNVSTPTPFSSFASSMSGPSMMLGAVARFGQQMMPNQLALNQYATTSMVGLNYNGMSRSQAMKALYSQAGAMPGSQSSLAMSPTDMYNAVPYLQQLGGTQLINQSSLGRAGMGAMAGFGISNPTLGAQSSAQLAAALYSPQFSLNMMRMGYNPIRSMSGGAPMNAGQAAFSILQGMGLNKMSPSRVFGNLASPKGQVDLSALFGQSGIANQQAQGFLQTYSQLFSKGLNPTQASNLIQQATFGSTSSMKSAQQRLNQLGVTTSTNDIQQLKNAQGVLSGRQGEYAGGFNDAINQSTSLLENFNNALNTLLNGPLGTGAGYAGGFAGVMSGTSRGVGMGLGLGGAMTAARLFGLGGGGAAAGGAGGSLFGAGAGAGAAIAPMLAAAVPMVAGMLIGAAAKTIGDKLSPKGSTAGVASNVLQSQHLLPMGMGSFAGIIAKLGTGLGGLLHIGGQGGGAGSVAQTRQQTTGGNNQVASVSGSAKKAVGAAESQVGVPYVYGDEIPGVGFDCSGLVQWAYKQAGVNLPRTSQAMWSALRKRSVSLNAVQEGDLVFTAGADGTASSPGHVGMMINSHQLIQAPHRGADVQVVGYDPHSWTAAARPSGSGSFIPGAGQATAVSSTGTGSSSLFAGNTGLGMGSGTYGSANEVDLISAMGAGMGIGMGFVGGAGGTPNGSSGTANKNTGSSAGGTTSVPGGKSGMVAIAKKIAAKYGWGAGSQWQDFIRLENMEAGWRLDARNSSSGAYGVAQFIKGPSEYYQYGGNPNTAQGQFTAMFNYIKQRYPRGPSEAWQHEISNNPHWYGTGGTLGPGMSIVGERGPELAINSGGQTHIFSNAQTNYLLNAIKGNVTQSPWNTNTSQGSSASSSRNAAININFNSGSIVIHSQGSHESVASKAGREVARQIVKHINHEAVSQAIRNGEKL